MARKRVPPEAQIIALFSGLSEESRRMVMFGLDALMFRSVPKSTAQSVEKKSKQKGTVQTSILNTAVETVSVGTVSNLEGKVDLPVACLICGFDEDYQDHFQPSPNYHAFDSSAKTKKGKAA